MWNEMEVNKLDTGLTMWPWPLIMILMFLPFISVQECMENLFLYPTYVIWGSGWHFQDNIRNRGIAPVAFWNTQIIKSYLRKMSCFHGNKSVQRCWLKPAVLRKPLGPAQLLSVPSVRQQLVSYPTEGDPSVVILMMFVSKQMEAHSEISFQCLLEGEIPPPTFTKQPILIPTGSLNLSSTRTTPHQGLTSRHSAPSLMTQDLSNALSDLRVAALQNELEEPISTRTHTRIHGLFSDTDLKSDQAVVNAVNVKTGASIFSLDVSPKVSRKNLMPKSRRNSAQRTNSVTSFNKYERARTTPRTNSKGCDTTNKDCELTNASAFGHLSRLTNSASSCDTENSASDEANGATEGEEECKMDTPELYLHFAAQTISVGQFNKVAYPDMYGHVTPPFKEPLVDKQFGVQR